MIDFARITIKAGDGGRGAGSFMHIKGKRRGKADGGDGGGGGNVYFVASADINTLERFRFVKDYEAKDGGAGEPQRRKGAEGADLEIKVPAGTQIKVLGPSTGATQGIVVYDLGQVGEKVLLARGGEGGRGNNHLRDEFGRRPFGGEAGSEGEVFNLELELKLIADVGLVGLPNAGKSTLISTLTSAKPKVAPYPFTTLEPNLGVMEAGPVTQKRLVLADIPGLIEGASEGRGLGDLFLRHIERTKMLLHLVEAKDANEVWENYQIVRGELKNYSKSLSGKKEVVVVTKIDLVDEDLIAEIKKLFGAKRKKVVFISAVTGEGLEALKKEILKRIDN